ncbi:hypothetical protein ACFL6Y_10350 [Elusimicrobiota bacterium]
MKKLILFLIAYQLINLSTCQLLYAKQQPQSSPIDLSASIEPSFHGFSQISTQTSRSNYAYLTQRTNIDLNINQYPWDMNLRLSNITLIGRNALPDELQLIETQYSAPGGDIFLPHAYVGYYSHFKGEDLRVELGAIPMHLGNGILLGNNGFGIMGAHLALAKYGPVGVEVYFGNTNNASPNPIDETFGLASLSIKGYGDWKFSFMQEVDKTQRKMATGSNIGKAVRNSSNVSYLKKLKDFHFSLEAVISQGHYRIPTVASVKTSQQRKVTTSGNAMVLEGGWKVKFPKLENLGWLDMSIVYGQGSGDKPGTDKDESYFAPAAKRFNGTNRTGWGGGLGASLFDAYASTPTWNGLPTGISGITLYGVTFASKRRYRALGVPLRFAVSSFGFRASTSDNLPKGLGSETSLAVETEIDKRFFARATIFQFSPGKVYELNDKVPNSITGTQIRVSIAF